MVIYNTILENSSCVPEFQQLILILDENTKVNSKHSSDYEPKSIIHHAEQFILILMKTKNRFY